MKRAFPLQLIGAAAVLTACQGAPLEGPPELRLGRDTCAECGMIISEKAFACALLVEYDGTREHAVFDDIGCMLDYQLKQEQSHQTIGSFVVDYKERRWITAESSRYFVVEDHSVRTPMASGIVAFSTEEAAHASLSGSAGRVLQWRELAAVRGYGPTPGVSRAPHR